MEELVSKCYAKITDIKPDNGKLRYLPHHGVKHPSKPGKVRIFSTAVPIIEEHH